MSVIQHPEQNFATNIFKNISCIFQTFLFESLLWMSSCVASESLKTHFCKRKRLHITYHIVYIS